MLPSNAVCSSLFPFSLADSLLVECSVVRRIMGRTKTRAASRADRLRVAQLAVAGQPTAEIARQLRLERHFVSRWRRRLSKVGNISDAGRSGRPSARTAELVHRVRIKLCGKKRKSTRAVAAELTAGGTPVSRTTVARAARDGGLMPHRPPKKPWLTASDQSRRLHSLVRTSTLIGAASCLLMKALVLSMHCQTATTMSLGGLAAAPSSHSNNASQLGQHQQCTCVAVYRLLAKPGCICIAHHWMQPATATS